MRNFSSQALFLFPCLKLIIHSVWFSSLSSRCLIQFVTWHLNRSKDILNVSKSSKLLAGKFDKAGSKIYVFTALPTFWDLHWCRCVIHIKTNLKVEKVWSLIIHFISFHFLNFFLSSNFLYTFTIFSLKDQETEHC